MVRLGELKVFSVVKNHLIDYPSPINLTYLWSFGMLSGMMLTIQILTGILLAMHYVPSADMAFNSIEHIMRDVNNGWLLRYTHSNGASFFFIVVYVHLFRGLYYHSYYKSRVLVWISGVLILLLMVVTAFLGYILPYGQMSFWGATVITNLVTAIPVIGVDIAQWLWGGFSVSTATLNRFFSLHYLFPFLIAVLAVIHIVIVHINGSTNSTGVDTDDYLPFYPYFFLKDLFAFLVLLIVFCFVIGYYPNVLSHSDNYIKANSLVTPTHIVPEWYYLPFYAILRSIPNKLGGVLCMFGSIISIAYCAILHLRFNNVLVIRNIDVQPVYQVIFWLFVGTCVILGWIGSQPVEYPFDTIGSISTFMYFLLLLIIMPLVVYLELMLVRVYFNSKKYDR